MKHESLLERLMEQPLAEARQKAIQEGFQEGFQEGMQEGRALGARENTIHSLMAVLDVRFQDSNVQILKPTFEAITDLQRLDQLLLTAVQASTIEEVVRTLVQPRDNGT